MSFETDVMDDLFYEHAEGPARQYDAYDEYDAADEYDALGDELHDDYDAMEALDDDVEGAEDDVMDAMEEAVVDALEADDTDEFLRRLARGIGRVARGAVRVARRVAPVVGRIARTVAPIASAIPLPWTQAIGRVANVVGRLAADDADEFEALDEMLEFGEYDDIDAAAPVIAGLTIRRTMPGAARLPRPQRRQLVRTVTQATRAVARRAGPQAARAVPQVVQAAARTARRRGVPARAVPRVVARATARVARSPQLARRIARSAPPAPAVRATPGTLSARRRSYTLRGPVTISIQGR